MSTQTTVPRIFKIMSERKLTAKQVSDEQKAETLNYIKYIKQKN